MAVRLTAISTLLCMGLISSTTHAQQFEWGDLPVLPGGLGFGGPFAGTHNGALIVAGGANFPNGMPWDGGTKVWYDDIHVLESGDVAWNSESSLPHPMAYGISISTPQGLIVAGGNDTDAVYADVWLLKWDADAKKVVVDTLPSLPKASVFHAGALLRQTVYVAAGRKSTTLRISIMLSGQWTLPVQWKRGNGNRKRRGRATHESRPWLPRRRTAAANRFSFFSAAKFRQRILRARSR